MDKLVDTVIPFRGGAQHGLRWLALGIGNGARLSEDMLAGVGQDCDRMADGARDLGGLVSELDGIADLLDQIDRKVGVVADIAARLAAAAR